MTDEENKQLAKLVTYLLESEDWTYIWLSEYSEPIRLFIFKTGLTFRRTKKYVDNAMNKLIGPIYYEIQSKLKRKVGEQSDLLFRPKPKISQSHKTHHHNAGKTLVPWSEFGRKYLEHYRLSEVPKTRLNMSVKEKSIKIQVFVVGRNKEKRAQSPALIY